MKVLNFIYGLYILFLSSGILYAQEEKQTIIAKFIITDATINGVDLTRTLVENESYIIFYTNEIDSLVYMANVWPKANTQSFGPISSFEIEKSKAAYNSNDADTYNFNWSYKNSFDNKKGTAKVKVIEIYQQQGIAFTLKINLENSDFAIYKGYMDASIGLSGYN